MDRRATARNVAIVLAIAAGVYWVPGGHRATATFESVLFVGFGVGIGYLGLRMYRERRLTLYGLGERHRALLYGSIALAALAVIAEQRMWTTGLGELAWFTLVGLVVYGLLAVYRHSRTY